MKSVYLFGKMLTFSRLKITTNDLNAIKEQLVPMLQNSTSSIPVVLDSEVPVDLPALVDMLWEIGVEPIGVVEGVLSQAAKSLRLATFPSDGKRIERIKPVVKTETTEPEAAAIQDELPLNLAKEDMPTQAQIATDEFEIGASSCVHNQMLRSGQSLQHLGGDLVVVGGVNIGAEAITDNSLHVYGRGQGRLVAGATGDKHARIFCQKFNPTLVSVAGTYCLNEAIPRDMIDKPVQVSYDEQKGLVFTLIPA